MWWKVGEGRATNVTSFSCDFLIIVSIVVTMKCRYFYSRFSLGTTSFFTDVQEKNQISQRFLMDLRATCHWFRYPYKSVSIF